MNADSIKIETDEDGFYMVVETSYTDAPWHTFHMRITDPEAFYDHVKAAIGPWLQEKYAAKAEYDRAKRLEDTFNLSDEEFSAYLDDAYGDNWAKRVGMQNARKEGYA